MAKRPKLENKNFIVDPDRELRPLLGIIFYCKTNGLVNCCTV